MKLLIDIGNTRIKWACAHDGVLRETGATLHRSQAPAAAVQWVAMLPEKPQVAYAVNVGGDPMETALRNALRSRWGAELIGITAQAQWRDLRNAYTDPGALGADRWAALVAAWHAVGDRVCVVDAGTAVTVDLVEADGRHLGGVIVPGLALMRAALTQQTSDLAARVANPVEAEAGIAACGKDTSSAIACGTRGMLAALIDRMAADFGDSAAAAGGPGRFPAVIVSGGDAAVLQPLLRCNPELRPQLVLEGLNLLAGEAR